VPSRPRSEDEPGTTGSAAGSARSRRRPRTDDASDGGSSGAEARSARTRTGGAARSSGAERSSTTDRGTGTRRTRDERGRGTRSERGTRRTGLDHAGTYEEEAPRGARARRGHGRTRRSRPPTRRRILVRRAGAVGTLLAAIALLVAALFTPMLGVRSVDVAGNTNLTADQVRSVAAVPMGSPMLRLSTSLIAARVSTLPRVASVDVSREWPFTVLIQITERNPVGVLLTGHTVHLVDDSGYDYATAAAAPPGLPVIQLPAASPADPRTRAVVEVLTALPVQLRPQVVSIGAQTPGSVQFAMTDGRTVEWGSADDSARKAAVLGALLTQPGRIYDVTSPSLPTIKS
jgi:cell division protein FtsQ